MESNQSISQLNTIEDLKERLLTERLHNLQCMIARIEDISKKTYEQASITNGRVTKLESANLSDRIYTLEHQVMPVVFFYKYRKTIIFTGFIMYFLLLMITKTSDSWLFNVINGFIN